MNWSMVWVTTTVGRTTTIEAITGQPCMKNRTRTAMSQTKPTIAVEAAAKTATDTSTYTAARTKETGTVNVARVGEAVAKRST